MIIVDREMLQQTDRSERTKEELLRSFYSNGWFGYTEFRNEQDWSKIRTFENNPEKSFIDDKLKIYELEDLHPPKERLLTWVCKEYNAAPMSKILVVSPMPTHPTLTGNRQHELCIM